MNEKLFLSIRDLIEHTSKLAFSVSELNTIFAKYLGNIMDTLHIAFIDSDFTAPFMQTAEVEKTIIYDSHKEYDYDRAYIYNNVTSDGAISIEACLKCAPVKDYYWTEEEQHNVKFVAVIIYILYSRMNLAKTVKQAYTHDVLTGIPNSAGLMNFILSLEPKTSSSYTCIFFNIKDFRLVNKALSSRRADMALKEYSTSLYKYVSDLGDGIVARLGGDNFFAIIPNPKIKVFLDYLKEVVVHVQDESLPKPRPIALKARAGVYKIDPATSPRDYIHMAAAAYQHAKYFLKEDCCWFTPDILSRELCIREMRNSFDSALANKEFIVYFQPKIDLTNMNLCGCEALVRWKKGDVIIPPLDFIPIFEEDGSVCKLDFYVLEHVCSLLRNWIDNGITPVPVSVNFSKVHLQNYNLTKDILEVVDKYNLSHDLIEIELTEQSDFDSFDVFTNFINTMSANDIKISIDDFGTGYSSINLLKNTAISTIKLDRSMLFELFSNSQNTAIIIKNIIKMANELNMEVLAEGVESREHADFLIQANCNMAQGYLFDKPMPSTDFEYRLKNTSY